MKRYDPEMIRDFFEQLIWEVRISIYEKTHRYLNEEMTETLKNYYLKRGAMLLPIVLTPIGTSPKTVAELKDQIAGERQAQIAVLEAALPVIESALATLEAMPK